MKKLKHIEKIVKKIKKNQSITSCSNLFNFDIKTR